VTLPDKRLLSPGLAARTHHAGLETIYVYNHLPRTGGMTIARVLGTWFEPVLDYQTTESDDARERWLAEPINIAGLRPGQVLIGHYTGTGSLESRYPMVFDNDRFRLITFLRDPWAATMSCLKSPAGKHLIETTDPSRGLMRLSGWMSRALGVPPLSPEAALGRYWFVGLTEYITESLTALATLLRVPLPNISRTNASPDGLVIPVSKSRFAEFCAASALDFKLHRIATFRLEQQLRHLSTGAS
jgi:hypothetical protein